MASRRWQWLLVLVLWLGVLALPADGHAQWRGPVAGISFGPRRNVQPASTLDSGDDTHQQLPVTPHAERAAPPHPPEAPKQPRRPWLSLPGFRNKSHQDVPEAKPASPLSPGDHAAAVFSEFVICGWMAKAWTETMQPHFAPITALLVGALAAPALRGPALFTAGAGAASVAALSYLSFPTPQRTLQRLPVTSLNDRWAVVSGADSELGRAVARQLAERDFHLVLVSRDAISTQALIQELRDRRRQAWLNRTTDAAAATVGSTGCATRPMASADADLTRFRPFCSHVVVGDVGNTTSPDEIFDKVQSLRLPVDVLVTFVAPRCHIFGNYLDQSKSGESEVSLKRLLAHTRLVNLFASDMLRRGGGRILVIPPSATDKRQAQQLVGPVPSASNAYWRCLSQALHYDLSPQGVTVTTAVPGLLRNDSAAVVEKVDLSNGDDRRRWPWPRMPPLFDSADEAACKSVNAALRGQPTVVCGVLNRGWVHVLSKLLPDYLRLSLARSAPLWGAPVEPIALDGCTIVPAAAVAAPDATLPNRSNHNATKVGTRSGPANPPASDSPLVDAAPVPPAEATPHDTARRTTTPPPPPPPVATEGPRALASGLLASVHTWRTRVSLRIAHQYAP